MIQREFVVNNPQGMHLRVASQVVDACRTHNADVRLCSSCKSADGCSILELLLLEALPQSVLRVEASGEGVEDLFVNLAQIFEAGGGI